MPCVGWDPIVRAAVFGQVLVDSDELRLGRTVPKFIRVLEGGRR